VAADQLPVHKLAGPGDDAPPRRRLLAGPIGALLAFGLVEGARREAPAQARPAGVNRPELLPATDGALTPVIDIAKILSERQEREIAQQIGEIEQASKVKLRVLTQTYPTTPGLAIRDYWKVDGKTLVYVHDTGGLGENAVVNFNAGTEVESQKPFDFWRRVKNKFGNRFYIQEHGDSDTVSAVVAELRDSFVPSRSQS